MVGPFSDFLTGQTLQTTTWVGYSTGTMTVVPTGSVTAADASGQAAFV